VFMLRQPSSDAIDRFVRDSALLPLSYGPVGIVTAPPVGFDLDELTRTIGHGAAAFDRARAALAGWAHFTLGWLEIFPGNVGTAIGAATPRDRVVYRPGPHPPMAFSLTPPRSGQETAIASTRR